MARLEFKLPTRWLVEGSVDDVYELICKPEDFGRWWSDVYLRVEEIEPGDENGVKDRKSNRICVNIPPFEPPVKAPLSVVQGEKECCGGQSGWRAVPGSGFSG